MQNENIICPDCSGENDKDAEKCIFCNYIFKEIYIQSKPISFEKKQIKKTKNKKTERERLGIDKSFNFDNNQISKYILLGAGIVGIIAFFIPFFEIDFIIKTGELSGFKEIKAIYQAIFSSNNSTYGKILINSFENIVNRGNTETTIGIFIAIFIFFGPILYGVFSLRMVFRSLFSNSDDYKPLKGALIRGLVYIAIAFITLILVGDEIGIDINFFKYVGAGFWLGNLTLILCFVSKITYSE